MRLLIPSLIAFVIGILMYVRMFARCRRTVSAATRMGRLPFSVTAWYQSSKNARASSVVDDRQNSAKCSFDAQADPSFWDFFRKK